MVSPLDDLVKRWVDPLMNDEGFVRLRPRRWMVSSAEGHAVFVEISPYASHPRFGFHVEWAPIPGVLRDYHEGKTRSTGVKGDWGLFLTRSMPPAEFAKLQGVRSSLWGFYPDRIDEDGAGLQRYLRSEIIPRWKSFLDQRRLSDAFFAGFDPSARKLVLDGDHAETGIEFITKICGYDARLGKIILGIDDGDPEELESLIDSYIEQDGERELCEWMRVRLRARTAGQAQAETGEERGE